VKDESVQRLKGQLQDRFDIDTDQLMADYLVEARPGESLERFVSRWLGPGYGPPT
jgi:hypothetical protein